MSKAARFFGMANVLFGFACGGSTSPPSDTVDGRAEASALADGGLDVADEPIADARHEPIADAAHEPTADAAHESTADAANDATADVLDEPAADAPQDATTDVAQDATRDLVVGDARATWQKLGLDNGSGPCPPQLSCSSSWDVSPDGHIAKISLGDAGAAQMTPTDLAELDSIVTSAPFLDAMANGFVCGQPPTDVFVRLRLERDGTSQMQGVTGCIFSGPAGNLPRRVNELVTKY